LAKLNETTFGENKLEVREYVPKSTDGIGDAALEVKGRAVSIAPADSKPAAAKVSKGVEEGKASKEVEEGKVYVQNLSFDTTVEVNI
jgi:hypothetical protein